MVYCRYCGKPIEDDSHFCPFCGKEQELKRGSINYSKLWKRFTYFTKNKFNNIQKFCSKIRIPKTRVNSPSRSRLILWAKRFSIITLTPIAVYLIFMLSLWIYGFIIRKTKCSVKTKRHVQNRKTKRFFKCVSKRG